MSARVPRFEIVLDRCLDDLAAGRTTLAQCLAAWPEYADRLRPLLETATVVRAMPQPPVDAPDAVRRAALLAQLRTTPQQRPRRRWGNPLRAIRLPALRLVAVTAPAAAIAAVAVIVLFALGRNTAYASTLTVFTGGAERQTGSGWEPVADGTRLHEGDRVRAPQGAHALLTFRDGSTVGLDGGADVRITQARFDGPRAIALTQYAGRLWNQVAADDRPGTRYTVAALDMVITVHGTVFASSVDGDTTSIDAAEGTVEVQAGDTRAVVRAGERVAARQHRIEPDTRAAVHATEVRVAAPFAASLVAPDGAATGARPDGLLFNQITGAVTTNPGRGPQAIHLTNPRPGEYTLRLRRVAAGGGEVVLAAGGAEPHRITVPDDDDTVDLRVRVDATGAISIVEPSVQPAGTAPARTGTPAADRQRATSSPTATRPAERIEAPSERLVITDAARQRAAELREQLKQRLEQQQREREQQQQHQRDEQQQQREQRQREEQQRRDGAPARLSPTPTPRPGQPPRTPDPAPPGGRPATGTPPTPRADD